MSAPIRSGTCGCCVSTRYNRYDTPPFYTYCGVAVLVGNNRCPEHRPEHERIATWRKPVKFLGKVIGYLQYKTGGRFSQYIVIAEHQFRKYFFWKEVYCEECKKWHFK